MSSPSPCARDHTRLPYVGGIVIVCDPCRDVGLGPSYYSVRGRGWRCRSCGWTMLAPDTSDRHQKSYEHQSSVAELDRQASIRARLSLLLSEVEKARKEREQIRALTAEDLDRREAEANAQIAARTQSARMELAQVAEQVALAREELAHERAELLEVRARAAEISGFADAEAKAHAAAEAEQRAAEETERARREAEERRAGEVDRRLLAGEDPQEIADSVEFTTEAKVSARRVALAKLRGSRGRPWAEAALDREIARLRSQGATRDAVRDLLGVGADRIRRVERGSAQVETGSEPGR